jgi:hypothetical protein
LCKAVTGVHWKPLQINKTNTKKSRFSLRKKSFLDLTSKVVGGKSELKLKRVRERYHRQYKFASYVVAELELLSNMSKGRNYNCINWLEKSFSYDMLLNMATNPLLPYNCNAVAMQLAHSIYVDRFPQFKHGGGASLPLKLWLFHDPNSVDEKGVPKSVTPVLKKTITLSSPDAFPAFCLTRLSSAYGDPNPVLSHPDHFKFFLLRKLYNDTVSSFGFSGRIIHDDKDFNKLGMAAIHGQQTLLLFGFQSTYVKLKELCEPNARLLDGRSDLKSRTSVFDPPESRYTAGGPDTDIVLQIKKELIKTFREVQDLCTNFRLAQCLHLFKEKAIKWTQEECTSAGIDFEQHMFSDPSTNRRGSAWMSFQAPAPKKLAPTGSNPNKCMEAKYIQQSTPEAALAMYHDFESLFPGGAGEAAKLDLEELCEKPDFNVALIDAMMYDDDELMAAALNLLDNVYGQRLSLLTALSDVELLDKPELPVFGSVHILVTQITELVS